jgi:hypothetical protein
MGNWIKWHRCTLGEVEIKFSRILCFKMEKLDKRQKNPSADNEDETC